MKITFIFAWYDFWFELFFETKKKKIYVFPIPMFGFQIELKKKVKKVAIKSGPKTDEEKFYIVVDDKYYWKQFDGVTVNIKLAGLFSEETADNLLKNCTPGKVKKIKVNEVIK